MELATSLSTLAFIFQAAVTCSRIQLNNNNTTNYQLAKKLQVGQDKIIVKEKANIEP